MRLTEAGRRQEVGVQKQALDATVRRQLNIPLDSERLGEEDRSLLRRVREEFDTRDVTPMNSKYGPISGMSEGERVLRAYRMGLLTRAGPGGCGAGSGGRRSSPGTP